MEPSSFEANWRSRIWDYDPTDSRLLLAHGGEVLTVAYMAQLARDLALLSPAQLPQVDLVVAVYALTDKRAESVAKAIYDWLYVGNADNEKGFIDSDTKRLYNILLNELPAAYRVGSDRQRILRVLLSDTHRHYGLGPSSTMLRDLLEINSGSVPVYISDESRSEADGRRAFELIAERYGGLEDLLTAADRLPEVTEQLPAPPSKDTELTASLLSELSQQSTTARLASLVPLVAAGLHVPPSMRAAEALRLGGVSDISNRGSLDTLVLSEHAYDADAFAARVANGEALFVQREPPPRPSKQPPLVAVDITLPCWGMPRLLGYAVALAMRTKARGGGEIKAVALGDAVIEFASNTKEDWIRALEFRSVVLSPIQALQALLEQSSKGGDLTLCTLPSLLDEPRLAVLLAQNPGVQLHVVTADSLGSIETWLLRGLRRKRLGAFNVDLTYDKASTDLQMRSQHPDDLKPPEFTSACPLTPPTRGPAMILVPSDSPGIHPEWGSSEVFRVVEKVSKPTRTQTNNEAELRTDTERLYRLGHEVIIPFAPDSIIGYFSVDAEERMCWTQPGKAPSLISQAPRIRLSKQPILNAHLVSSGQLGIVRRGVPVSVVGDLAIDCPTISFYPGTERSASWISAGVLFGARDLHWGSIIHTLRFIGVYNRRQLSLNGHSIDFGSSITFSESRQHQSDLIRSYDVRAPKRGGAVRLTCGISVRYAARGILALAHPDNSVHDLYIRMQLGTCVCLAYGGHYTGHDWLLPGSALSYSAPHNFESYLNPYIDLLSGPK